jgi:hypothetical protein
VSLSGNQAIFTWPADAAGFTLQSSPILGPGANWTAVGTPALVGDHYEVALPLSGAAFFRLRR